jgi:hypothetical protein
MQPRATSMLFTSVDIFFHSVTAVFYLFLPQFCHSEREFSFISYEPPSREWSQTQLREIFLIELNDIAPHVLIEWAGKPYSLFLKAGLHDSKLLPWSGLEGLRLRILPRGFGSRLTSGMKMLVPPSRSRPRHSHGSSGRRRGSSPRGHAVPVAAGRLFC